MKEIIPLICETAKAAGMIALERRKNFENVRIFSKETPADLVTDVDREVERFIIDRLKQATPEFGFIGEESGVTDGTSEWAYCIDPIDGTTSYVHGSPVFSVSIGVLRGNEFYAGAVFAPQLNELYYAEKGKGAFLNGVPIHASTCQTLGEALCSTGFACIRARKEKNNLEYFAKIVPQLQEIRRTGSAAFDICQVAAGRFDGYWEFYLHQYDIAAGAVIAMEAGALFTDIDGGKEYLEKGLVCAAPGVHPLLCHELH